VRAWQKALREKKTKRRSMKQSATERRDIEVESKFEDLSLEDMSFPWTPYRYETLLSMYNALQRDFALLERRFLELRRKLRDIKAL
jgi:hypothetical protein